MTDEPLDEINSRDCFLYVFIIFMAIVMESNSMTVIVIDSGGCDLITVLGSQRFGLA